MILSIASILAAIIGAFYWAYTLSWLWFWFAVPFGLPAIGMAHAFGLQMLTFSVLTTRGAWGDVYAMMRMERGDTGEKRIFVITFALLGPSVILGGGYVAKTFL